MKVRIKTFNGELPEYLTVGKVYTLDTIHNLYGGLIVADDNEEHYILLDDCAYLNSGSWEVINEN